MFPKLHHEESPEKPQFNMATTLILDNSLSFCFTPSSPFLTIVFRPPPPISINLKNSTPPPPFMRGGGRGSVQTMNRLLDYGVTMDLHKESFIETGESCLHRLKITLWKELGHLVHKYRITI